jgi:7-carboxy-7-deazaguanine synthase
MRNPGRHEPASICSWRACSTLLRNLRRWVAAPVTLRGEAVKPERLRINEIFHSLQGEADCVGFPTVFVRLTGCPLRCQYCDTEYAFHSGEWLDLDDILKKVAGFGAAHVCVTGGEPLAQPNCLNLLKRLCDAGFAVSLETSGALDVAAVDERVARVIDVKTPGSQEAARNRIENFAHLLQRDQLKFVICSREDYDWSKAFLQEHGLFGRCTVLFSPSYKQLPAAQLADWILEDRLPVRFQLQLHKILWGDVPGK